MYTYTRNVKKRQSLKHFGIPPKKGTRENKSLPKRKVKFSSFRTLVGTH